MKRNKVVLFFALGGISLGWSVLSYLCLFFPEMIAIVCGSTALGFFLGGFFFCVYAIHMVRRR